MIFTFADHGHIVYFQINDYVFKMMLSMYMPHTFFVGLN